MTRTWMTLIGAILVAGAVLPGCGDDGARPYDLCIDSSDCTTETDGCSIISTASSTAGICTNNCGSDLDCPRDIRGTVGACLSLSGSAFVCFERCFDDFDCPSNFLCTPTAGGASELICLPP
ncbi:hypothetical protein [Sandaracinus amylolyticus]|uniref:hypothetical protein n=1 Tax=Sandaracinus amylolyticus TaxID=927083 RepID=UPI001F311BA6|nr:hypothetical protein [Sandaracinus amylolyticus]UJR85238.1 Hypothetical protein I5071_73180 [Sandaracinus amylolyticus]